VLRFGRDYKLLIRFSKDEVIEVLPPFRVAFDGEKSIFAGLNKISIDVYNLSPKNRDRIFKDKENRKEYFQVILSVGYENTQNDIIFKGDIFQAYTEKKDNDYITKIICESGGFDYKNSFTSKTITNQSQVMDQLLNDMPNTQKGSIDINPVFIARAKVLVGATSDILQQEIGLNQSWFIDDEKLFILKENQIIDSVAVVINADTGLLTVPTRANQLVEAQTIMNPAIRLGGLVQLVSEESKNLNGFYKVEVVKYKGDFRGNEWKQILSLRLNTDFEVVK